MVLLVIDTCYYCLIRAKSLRIRFNKLNEFNRIYDSTTYLVLFGPETFDAIFNRITVKSGITYVISHNCAKIKIDSFDSFPLEKTLTLHKVIILIKSVFNKYNNNCCYNIFLEKGLYKLPKDNDNK